MGEYPNFEGVLCHQVYNQINLFFKKTLKEVGKGEDNQIRLSC